MNWFGDNTFHEWLASWLPDWAYGCKLRPLCWLSGHRWTQGAPWKDFVCWFCGKRIDKMTKGW